MIAPLSLTVDLHDGGRITSLRGRAGEWLLPTSTSRGETFTEKSLGGWDEMLPTIDPAVVATADGAWAIGDHGEAWRTAWSGTSTQHTVRLDRLRLDRSIEAHPGGAVLRYRLASRAPSGVPAIWAPHPQLLLDDDATLDVGIAATWRQTSPRQDLMRLPARFTPAALVPDGEGAKLWLDDGVDCIVLRRGDGASLSLRWDATVLPHLAIWIDRCHLAERQVVVIEPCSSGHDSLATAVEAGQAWWLEPGETRAWALDVDERLDDGDAHPDGVSVERHPQPPGACRAHPSWASPPSRHAP